MSNQPAPDSAPVAGTQSPPTPAVSSPSSGQPNSGQTGQPALDPKVLAQQLLANPTFADELRRGLQSGKDRRFSEHEKRLQAQDAKYAEVVERLRGLGVPITEAQQTQAVRDSVVDQVFEQLPTLLAQGSADGSGAANAFAAKTADLLAEAGIPNDDPEVKAMAAKPYASEADWYRDLTRLAVARAKGQAPAPNGALVATGSGQPALTPDREQQRDQLTARLIELNKNPSANFEQINEARAKLRALLPVSK